MADMMILAFQTDLTRTCTLMFANDGSNRNYAQIGVPEGHHDMSHHGGNPIKLDKKRKIDRFHVEQLGLHAQEDGEHSGADRLLAGQHDAGLRRRNQRRQRAQPRQPSNPHGRKGQGTIPTGRHIKYKDGTPLTNLYLDILERVGARTEKPATTKRTSRNLLS